MISSVSQVLYGRPWIGVFSRGSGKEDCRLWAEKSDLEVAVGRHELLSSRQDSRTMPVVP